MNNSPNMAAIIPIIIVASPALSNCFFILHPNSAILIPKNNRLTPTITETKASENNGNIMNIKPRIIEINPTPLLKF